MIKTNMTNEQIKLGMDCCTEFLCGECPYNIYEDPSREKMLRCIHLLMVDVYNYMLTLKEEKTAYWVSPTKIDGRMFSIYHCSACSEIPYGIDKNSKYCPNCGAKIEKGVESND